MGVAGEFQNLHAFFYVRSVSFLEPVDLALAETLLFPPLVRHLLEERRINHTVELIHVHGVDTVLEPLIFSLMALDRFLMLAPLVGVAGMQGIPNPFQHLVIEAQPAQEFRELLLQQLLAHMLAAAGCRISPTLICVSSAMVVDIALLLDLADHRAAALGAGDQS